MIGVLLGNKKGRDGLIHPGFSSHTREQSHMALNTSEQCDDLIVGLIMESEKVACCHFCSIFRSIPTHLSYSVTPTVLTHSVSVEKGPAGH